MRRRGTAAGAPGSARWRGTARCGTAPRTAWGRGGRRGGALRPRGSARERREVRLRQGVSGNSDRNPDSRRRGGRPGRAAGRSSGPARRGGTRRGESGGARGSLTCTPEDLFTTRLSTGVLLVWPLSPDPADVIGERFVPVGRGNLPQDPGFHCDRRPRFRDRSVIHTASTCGGEPAFSAPRPSGVAAITGQGCRGVRSCHGLGRFEHFLRTLGSVE
jgi:hypothetical protein